MTLSTKDNERFFKNQDKSEKIILDNVKKRGHIIHGQKALNKQFPSFLDKSTDDFDVFSTTPRQTANRVERKLDQKFGGDFFRVEKGRTEGVHKIKSNVTEKTVADYSKAKQKVSHIIINGVKYADINHFKRKAKESLRNPDNEFRHDKDREQLRRIAVFEAQRKKARPKPKPRTFTQLVEFPRKLPLFGRRMF